MVSWKISIYDHLCGYQRKETEGALIILLELITDTRLPTATFSAAVLKQCSIPLGWPESSLV